MSGIQERTNRVRVTSLAGLAGLLATGVVLVSGTPAHADAQLCTGNSYSTCLSLGYADHGYSSQSDWSTHQYWGAFAGHNCTNYVAYVETRNGATTSTHGMAYEWDNYVSTGVTVNTTPAVGAVAQWEANYHGASSSGHVAYVEAVNMDGSVTVSEDNSPSGPFSWRTLTANGSTWPSHFLHFKDLPTAGPWGGLGSATFLGSDTLTSGQQLQSNQYLLSPDARFALTLQTDGNLVLYAGQAIWQSGTSGSGATHLDMQTDGNLVLYTASNTAVWQSGTSGTGQAALKVQSDGNVVAYNDSSGNPTWWTGTGGNSATTSSGSDTLTAGHQLNAAQQEYLRSSDKRYGLLLQSDGTLVLYGPGYHVLWSRQYAGATRLVMQTDGNLVLYNANMALWWTGTGSGTNRVIMQTDGNLVTYTASNSPTWWTGTGGQL